MTLTIRTGAIAAAFLVCSAAFAQETPAPIAPAPPPQQAPAAPKPTRQPPVDPENIESMASISAYVWRPSRGEPGYRAGTFTSNKTLRTLDLPGDPKGFGAVLTFPTGGFNRLEIGFARTEASASFRPGRQVNIFGANIPPDTLLDTTYDIDVINVRWNYLTFPVPPLDSRLRIKTFWEAHYAKYKPLITFPEDVDSDGNNRGLSISQDQTLFYPGVGIGLEFVPVKAFRIEAGGSGMALPGRSRYLDVSAQAVVRVGRFEVFGGYKGYHFRTSPRKEIYITGTLVGPLFGLRWVFD